jgi:hypothetical protein
MTACEGHADSRHWYAKPIRGGLPTKLRAIFPHPLKLHSVSAVDSSLKVRDVATDSFSLRGSTLRFLLRTFQKHAISKLLKILASVA